MKKAVIQKGLILILFLTYLVVGCWVYRDYGISPDEPTERESTFTNLKYMVDTLGIDELQGANGDLENYTDRYYGIAMQIPPALVEWAKDFPGGAFIYYIRHIWTFLVCMAGYVCFYFMCKNVFVSRWISILGTAMLALFPRFFAEQFYNIKDMIFVSMVIMSMFATVKLIESNYSVFWAGLFAIITAAATNVRIVGVIFPVLLLGYLWLTGILNKCGLKTGEKMEHVLRTSIIVIAGYFLVYIILMPILWKNPIGEIINVFSKFSDFDGWNGTIVFMGNIIRADELPWYYIPVWMLISLPVWYIGLFIVAAAVYAFALIKKVKSSKGLQMSTLFQNKYLIWAALVGFLPWLATAVAHSTLYNGWRHCYFMLPSIIFVMLGGIKYLWRYFEKNRIVKGTIIIVSTIGFLLQTSWIIKNHPYQMVYLNAFGRNWGEEFDRDYWHLTHVDLCRYILEHDNSETISIGVPGNVFLNMLTDEERARIVIEEEPMYYLETYRGKTGSSNVMEGYEDYYSITVDGYRIATIFKRLS